MTRLILQLLVLAAALAACGGGDEPPGPGTGAGTGSPPSEAGEEITASENGQTFMLTQGTETSLRLSSEYVWAAPVVEGDAVELSPVDYLQDPGFSEWLVRTVRSGTATISSLGTPACAGQDGCLDEPIRFQVTIAVPG